MEISGVLLHGLVEFRKLVIQSLDVADVRVDQSVQESRLCLNLTLNVGHLGFQCSLDLLYCPIAGKPFIDPFLHRSLAVTNGLLKAFAPPFINLLTGCGYGGGVGRGDVGHLLVDPFIQISNLLSESGLDAIHRNFQIL